MVFVEAAVAWCFNRDPGYRAHLVERKSIRTDCIDIALGRPHYLLKERL